MTWIQSILLGLLQGLTEFLPVSSTAHMDIAGRLMLGHDVGAAFSAVVQLGPMFAVLFYFRKDLVRYVHGVLRTRSPRNIPAGDLDARLGWYVIIGFIPLAVLGLLLEKKIDTSFRRLDVVAAAEIILALILLGAELKGKRNRGLADINMTDTMVIGWAQVLALVPGTSRSGVTITAGLFRNIDREDSTRFSFLLSIPVIVGAGLYKLLKLLFYFIKPSHFTPDQVWNMHPWAGTLGVQDLEKFLLATVVAGFLAYVIIVWFMHYMENHSTYLFIGYRILIGIVVIILLHNHDIANQQMPAPNSQVTPASMQIRAQQPRIPTRQLKSKMMVK